MCVDAHPTGLLMAIYHLALSLVRRRPPQGGRGRSSVAAAAYRAGERLTDERTGIVHDYRRRAGSVHGTEVLVPVAAPPFARVRSSLWNAVEHTERRVDARVAREVNVAIPRELSRASMQQVVRDFAREAFVRHGMVVDVAWHDLDSPNPHAHMMVTTRPVDADGFAVTKPRNWNSVAMLQEWRALWEAHCNDALEREGRRSRVDRRSLAAQGVPRLPLVHVGPRWTALNRERPGTPLPMRDQRSQANAAIAEINAAREARWQDNRTVAARSAAAHYDRLIELWHRDHSRSRLRAIVRKPVPSVDRFIERLPEYRTRLREVEEAAKRAGLALGVEVAGALAHVEELREGMRRWVDGLRDQFQELVDRLRERRVAAQGALRQVEDLEARAGQWRTMVRDDIPAHLDRRTLGGSA